MKKIYALLALAGFALNASADDGTIKVDTVYTFDFVKAGTPVTLNKSNCKDKFYSWEKEGKEDSGRQDYIGILEDDNSKAAGLPETNHVWSRNNPRMYAAITSEGFALQSDRNIVVDGLVRGDSVIFKYTTTATDASREKMLYATGASGKAIAHLNKTDTLKVGTSVIASGDTIVIDSADFVGNNGNNGYISVFGYKEMTVSSITILKTDGTSLVYDYVKAGSPLSLSNLNRNQGNSGKIYVYESSEEGKTDKNANDFKGYTADTNSKLVGLPDVCNVFQRSNRIVQSVTANGIKVTADKIWAVDGLDSLDQVQIYYTADDASTKTIKYATGATTGTVAYLGSDSLKAETEIASGDVIDIASTTLVDNTGKANGAICFQAYKNMYVTKVVITKRSADENAVVYNFAAAAAAGETLTKAGTKGYFVNMGEGKENRNPNNFKKYENYTGSNLPAECHVAIGDNPTLTEGGLVFSNSSRYLVIDSLKANDVVTVYYDNVPEGSTVTYCPGESVVSGGQVIAFEDGTVLESTKTVVPSGTPMCVRETGSLNYIVLTGFKDMTISKVTVVNNSDIVATDIQEVETVAPKTVVSDAIYNLAGQKVGADYKGIVIKNGKKIMQK